MLAIIQARTNSKRFRNKILYKINGKPLIWYVINSVKKAKKITKVIVSTSNTKNDDKLIKYLKSGDKEGIFFYDIIIVEGEIL